MSDAAPSAAAPIAEFSLEGSSHYRVLLVCLTTEADEVRLGGFAASWKSTHFCDEPFRVTI